MAAVATQIDWASIILPMTPPVLLAVQINTCACPWSRPEPTKAPAKSVIWLFMVGGASHIETFDTKPALTKYADKTISETPFEHVVREPRVTKNFRMFAGAKEVATIDAYDKALSLNRFELLIDWGHFYFITQPMFWAIDHIYRYVGNFGLAILIITVIIKGIFFPLANKSYASMAKMKAVQPELAMIRERYGDDKMKQQQAMM